MPKVSKNEDLNSKSVKELQAMCKKMGIEGCSKGGYVKKDALIKMIKADSKSVKSKKTSITKTSVAKTSIKKKGKKDVIEIELSPAIEIDLSPEYEVVSSPVKKSKKKSPKKSPAKKKTSKKVTFLSPKKPSKKRSPKKPAKKRCDDENDPLDCDDEEICDGDTGRCIDDTDSNKKDRWILKANGRTIVGSKSTIANLKKLLGGKAKQFSQKSSAKKKSKVSSVLKSIEDEDIASDDDVEEKIAGMKQKKVEKVVPKVAKSPPKQQTKIDNKVSKERNEIHETFRQCLSKIQPPSK